MTQIGFGKRNESVAASGMGLDVLGMALIKRGLALDMRSAIG